MARRHSAKLSVEGYIICLSVRGRFVVSFVFLLRKAFQPGDGKQKVKQGKEDNEDGQHPSRLVPAEFVQGQQAGGLRQRA